MAIVVLKLADVKWKREARPKKCRYGGGTTFQRWGQVNKPVKDVQVRNVKVYRYRRAEKLQLGHQVCQFHVRRWVGKALKELQETIPKQCD